jgi:heme exporter protein D
MLSGMDRIATFFAMGGYAAYVWPAFAVAAMVMVGLVISTMHTLRRREREIAEIFKGRPLRPGPPPRLGPQ